MSRDEIIAMAREAGFTANCGHTDRDGTHHPAINALSASVPREWLERFAALVAAKEREACAQICDTTYYQFIGPEFGEVRHGIVACAAAIRARSTT